MHRNNKGTSTDCQIFRSDGLNKRYTAKSKQRGAHEHIAGLSQAVRSEI